MILRFTSVAEALRARALVQVEQRPVARSLARSARRRSGPGSTTPRRARSRSRRRSRAAHAATRPPPPPRRARSISSRVRSKTSPTPLSTPSASEPSSRGHPEPQSLQVRALGQPHLLGQAERGRVARVVADHVPQQERGVGDRARERAALVQRRRERDHAVAGDRPVGRLQPDDAAQRRRLADRSSGVGPDRPRARVRPPPPPPTRRSTRREPAPDPTGCARAVTGVLVRRAHRELVHVRLADHRRAGRRQAPHRRRRVQRPVALEDPGAGGGRHALGAEQVLDRERHARQRRAGSSGAGASSAVQRNAPMSPSRRRSALRTREQLVGPRSPAGLARPPRRRSASARRRRSLARGRDAEPAVGWDRAPLERTRSLGQLGRGSSGRRTFSTRDHVRGGRRRRRGRARRSSRCGRAPKTARATCGRSRRRLEPQPSEARDVEDLVAIDHRGEC